MHSRANAPPPLPAFGDLDVQASPLGFVVRPRVRATSWLIEAAVWLVAGAGAAAMLALGSAGWMRIVGAVVLVSIGLRAVLRTTRFVASKSFRQLSVALRAPVPHLAGPFAKTPLAHVVRFDVSTDRGDRYFSAVETGGRTIHLVTIEPADEPAYRALGSWLEAQRGR